MIYMFRVLKSALVVLKDIKFHLALTLGTVNCTFRRISLDSALPGYLHTAYRDALAKVGFNLDEMFSQIDIKGESQIEKVTISQLIQIVRIWVDHLNLQSCDHALDHTERYLLLSTFILKYCLKNY